MFCLFSSGPPGEVSGLYADPGTPTTNSIDIFFFPGATHGFQIDYFIVEFEIQSEKGKWHHSNETFSKVYK
jgi:hypothetical protein